MQTRLFLHRISRSILHDLSKSDTLHGFSFLYVHAVFFFFSSFSSPFSSPRRVRLTYKYDNTREDQAGSHEITPFELASSLHLWTRIHPYRTPSIIHLSSPRYDIGNSKMGIKVHLLFFPRTTLQPPYFHSSRGV